MWACKLEIYLLYLQSNPYFMQVTLRKQNPFIAGNFPATTSILTTNDIINYRFSVAGIFQSIIFRSKNRLSELINSYQLRVLILWNNAWQFRNETLKAGLNTCFDGDSFNIK